VEQELKEIINPPPPPPEPGTKKKVTGSKAARAQAKRFKEGLKVAIYSDFRQHRVLLQSIQRRPQGFYFFFFSPPSKTGRIILRSAADTCKVRYSI